MIRHGGRRSQAPVVICKCKSHCTTLNPATGRYEGAGQPQTRPTRDNHMRDDSAMRSSNLPATTLAESGPVNGLQQAQEEVDVLLSQPFSSPHRPFKFINNPEENGRFVWPNDDEILLPNQGMYSLRDDQANRPYLLAAYRLCDLYNWASHVQNQPLEDVESLLDYIKQRMGDLTRLKEIEWSQQRGNSGVDVPYINTDIHFRPFGPPNRTIRVSVVLSLVMENIFFMPRRALRTLLAGARSLLRASGATDTVIDDTPVDPRAGSHRAMLNPNTRQFLVCPTCHTLYPLKPGDSPRNDINPFISECKERRTPESEECNTRLWKDRALKNGGSYPVPIRKYLHQDLKSWVGRLLARKGMEELIDSQNVDLPSSTSPIHDIWSSEVFRSLKDNSGRPFFPGPAGEGRLVFSLSVDSFNPFHNKTAKQSVSSTGIWMVLLNLPPHLRYLHKNMYVAGVIPGPDKPSKEDIYPYVDLVMKDLLEFWFTGVRFSRTESNLLGRLFRAMLIPLICDMLAARQIAGLSSTTSHSFCTFCDLDSDDVDIADRTEWPAKDVEHIRRIAHLWKNAANVREQELIFDSYGIRWSPLHTLPYWDVVRFTVVDPMHALDLNLFQNHCRVIFQIDTKDAGGNGIAPAPRVEKRITSREHIRSLRRCIQLIRLNGPDLVTELILHSRPVLYQICLDNGILGNGHQLIVGTKWVLANNVWAWRQRMDYQDVIDRSVPLENETEEEEEEEEPSVSQPTALPSDSGLDRTLVTRVLRHILDRDDPDTARGRAYTQGSVAIFLYICTLVHIECSDVDASRRNAKRLLFNKIISRVDVNNETARELQSYIPNTDASTSRAVLGIDVMKEIWSDMSRTQLPTWVSPAPPTGAQRREENSAPIIGGGTERKQRMLAHFMDLVSAVRIANMRITSPTQIQDYNQYMTRYITEIKTLYPDQVLKPTHHAALHIGDMLGLFGPNHSHSGPHYERYINFFHRVNTNMKIGELESTMLNTSARSANIRAVLSDDEDLRRAVMELVSVMDNVDQEDARGFRLAAVLDPDSPTYTPRSKSEVLVLSSTYHQLLCHHLDRAMEAIIMPKEATFLKEIARNGVCYGVSTSSTFRNSSIMFQDRSGTSLKAGIASHIFRYRYPTGESQYIEDHFFVIQELTQVEEHPDPYRSFIFGGYIGKPTGRELIISVSQVVSHFALTRLDDESDLVHILPVDRLMLEFNAIDLGQETAA